MTGEELVILASHAFGKFWIRPLARRCGVKNPANVLKWKKSRVPRARELQVIEVCLAEAEINLRNIRRISRYLKSEISKRAKKKAALAPPVRETAFARSRKKAVERYLAYSAKADAARLGWRRRRVRVKPQRPPAAVE